MWDDLGLDEDQFASLKNALVGISALNGKLSLPKPPYHLIPVPDADRFMAELKGGEETGELEPAGRTA